MQAEFRHSQGEIDDEDLNKVCGGAAAASDSDESDEEESSDDEVEDTEAEEDEDAGSDESDSADGAGGAGGAGPSKTEDAPAGPVTPASVKLAAWFVFLFGALSCGLSLYTLFSFSTRSLEDRLESLEKNDGSKALAVAGYLASEIKKLQGKAPGKDQK